MDEIPLARLRTVEHLCTPAMRAAILRDGDHLDYGLTGREFCDRFDAVADRLARARRAGAPAHNGRRDHGALLDALRGLDD